MKSKSKPLTKRAPIAKVAKRSPTAHRSPNTQRSSSTQRSPNTQRSPTTKGAPVSTRTPSTKRTPVAKASKGRTRVAVPVADPTKVTTGGVPEVKSVDPTRDSTPTVIDNKLERMAGTSQLTRVAGGGRPYA